ncbi:MAG TPA: GtrA family protein [Polyangiaceae bacterium]|nr:GtrA family protein [Polyangiaceae bacterium]
MVHPLQTLSRSAVVGLVATALDFLVLIALVSGLGMAPRLASLPALSLGIATQFVGNKWLAFRDPSRDWLRQAACFLVIEACGFVCNAVCFDRLLVLTHLPYVVCRVLSTSLVYFAVCLPLWTRLFSSADQGKLDV